MKDDFLVRKNLFISNFYWSGLFEISRLVGTNNISEVVRTMIGYCLQENNFNKIYPLLSGSYEFQDSRF